MAGALVLHPPKRPMDSVLAFTTLAGFFLGACLGSFLAACVDRRERGLTPSDPPRSECPGCKKQLKWWENIPLASYIFLGGRCAACGWKIPMWYFLFELGMGTLLGAAGWVLGAFLI